MLLDRMARAGFDFGRVVGIAGDAQVVFTNQKQHITQMQLTLIISNTLKY